MVLIDSRAGKTATNGEPITLEKPPLEGPERRVQVLALDGTLRESDIPRLSPVRENTIRKTAQVRARGFHSKGRVMIRPRDPAESNLFRWLREGGRFLGRGRLNPPSAKKPAHGDADGRPQDHDSCDHRITFGRGEAEDGGLGT